LRAEDSRGDRRTPETMAAGGDSRSMFVVQRAFRRVRRGYDPEEVDRHLQLVSEWFSQGRGGRTAREAEQQLVAREQAMAAAEEEARKRLDGAQAEAEATLEGARLRAAADIEAARREAERILEEARADGERRVAARLAETEDEVKALRAEREREVEAYIERRRREADRLVEAARRERFGADERA
jgi:DivIVA domain-containing protein